MYDTDDLKMGSSCWLIVLCGLTVLYVCEGRISDKRQCGDPTCSEPVSLAKTLIRYTSDDVRILSFKKNVNCEIYSKSAGSRPDLWGAKINGVRGYVPYGLVREYKVLKTSLEFVVNTEEAAAENVSDSSVERVTDRSLKNVSSPVNVHEASNLEAALNDVEHSGLEPYPGSGVLTATPTLDHESFSGSGVSAEQIESENSPNHEINRQPYEVVDGTTLYYETDGKQTESNLHPPQVQPTFTTLSFLPSILHERKSTPEDEPASNPSAPVIGPSEERTGVDSDEKVTGEGHSHGNEEVETVKKEEQESDEKMTESVPVTDKKETDPATGSEVTTVEKHKQKAENVEHKYASSVDETKSKAEDIENEKEDIVDEHVEVSDVESEGSEEEDDDEGKEYEEEDDEDYEEDDDDIEEEINDREAELPSTDVDDEKLLEDVEAVNTGDKSIKPAESDALQVEDQGTMQPTLETDMNINSVFTNISQADDLNLQENAKDSFMAVELQENISDNYKPSNVVATDEQSAPEHASLPAADSQNLYDNADHTEGSVGIIEEMESRVTRKAHADVTEGEESDIHEQVKTQKVVPDTDDQLHSPESVDTTVKEKDVIGGSNKVLMSVHDSDYPESVSESQKMQDENVHPELAFDKIADHKSELSSEIKDKIKSNLSEEPHTDSTQGETETTTTSSEEAYEFPVYGPSAEEMSTSVPTLTSEEPLVPGERNELVSDEHSGGLLSGISDTLSSGIGVLTSMFGDLSADSPAAEVPEDVSESKPEVAHERLSHVGKAEDTNRNKNAGPSSLWEGPDRGHTVIDSGKDNVDEEEERASATCNVNYDPSAGIDSDCSDVSGDLPNNQQNAEEEPSVPEEAVTVKFTEDDKLTMDLQQLSYETSLYLIITAATVLLFSLGHYYIEKRRRDGSLVAKINGLEKELLVSSKECLILKDGLQATKEKLLSVESSHAGNSEMVVAVNAELTESKVARAELEEQVAALEKELEVATEAGLELNHMLSEFLSAQHGSDTVMKSVEQLQKQLDSQKSTITTMTASLNAKNTENETLQTELTAAKDRINSLEEDLQKVNENLNDVLSAKLAMEEHLLEKNKSLQTELHEVKDRMSRDTDQLHEEKGTLQEMVNELKDAILTKESEITVLQDCLRQLKNTNDEEDDDKFQELLDAGHVKAELKRMSIERDTLAEKLQDEVDARKLLEDHVRVISEEVTRLRGSYEEAEREKIEAQTRLEVLSNYFKEKETQLQKELGLQEAMCLQKEGDATSTYERIKSLQEETENYRSQNDTLKKEILDQERGLKCQIATLEKKAHENWVAARQAERKLEESKQEASQLRNRLVIVEKNVLNTSKTGETPATNDRVPGDSNGELPTSPVHMGISSFQDSPSSPLHYHHPDGMPISPPLPALIPGQHLPPSPFLGMPPPGMFMPPPPPGAPFMPPPPPLFPGDRRPPPVGRMSSPPPHHYSPPPPGTRVSFSSYDHSPPPSPPSARRSRASPAPDSPDSFRQHRSPPPSYFNPYAPPTSRPSPHRDDSHRFRPLPPPPIRRDSPRDPKVVLRKGWKKYSKIRQFWSSKEAGGGSALSCGHSSGSSEKSSQSQYSGSV